MHEPSTLALEKSDISLIQTLDSGGRPCLIQYSGSESGRRFDLDCGELVIGRGSEVDVPIDGRGISRRHAVLSVTPQGVSLRDLGSANCSYVNDCRVLDSVPLKDGDMLRLANVLFRFHDRRSLDALLHDRLYRMATVDPGTGVFNRRHTQESLKLEWARALRSGQPLALVCCDLDHFKSVNDSWGHAAGDSVLKDCATLLRAELRAGDVIGRWGGEEFIVVARDTAVEHALALAERLRLAVARHPFELELDADGQPHRVRHQQTVSLGLAMAQAGMRDEHDLLALADRRMYAAKHRGRNRVVAADGSAG